jgi:hypothetical protein
MDERMTDNKQLQRTVMRRRERAAAEPERYTAQDTQECAS